MKNKDLYFNDQKPIDILTDYGKGFEPEVDPRTEYGKGFGPQIDPATGFVVGSEEYNRVHNPIKDDYLTNFGRGITFKTCDGKEVATMEEVMQYNQMFYERMKNKIDNHIIENRGMHK